MKTSTNSSHGIASPESFAMPVISRRTMVAGLIAATAAATSGRKTGAQESTPAASGTRATPAGPSSVSLLPRDVVLSLADVQEILPEIASESGTGLNSTVMGTPVANRVVTYATADGAHRLVLSVDQYDSAAEASRIFNEALEASQDVPGVTTETVSGLGEAALIGVVTQGDETHVGGGALYGDLIVNATLQAFEGTDDNKDKVAALIRKQAERAEQELESSARATPTPVG